jgi:hypothetical protein
MNGCTINIADFRCRAIARTIGNAARRARRPHGFASLELGATSTRLGTEMLQEAVLREDPTVYDIGIAREVQRLRHRAVIRSISIPRKAKVLRFRNEPPAQPTGRIEEGRRMEDWSGMPDGPFDLPPAA